MQNTNSAATTSPVSSAPSLSRSLGRRAIAISHTCGALFIDALKASWRSSCDPMTCSMYWID